MKIEISKSVLLFVFVYSLPFMLLSCAGHIPGGVAPEKPLFPSGAESSLQAENLDDLALHLAGKLDRVIDLDGKKIQISENNFLELDTRLNLLFSCYLSEALAAAITRYGARVTVQEIGEEPLRLFGNFGKYAPGKNHLKITIRLRKMGQVASEDIAVSGNISTSGLEKEWFEPDFSRVANTLINILEDNYHGDEEHLSVSVETLWPGRDDQKPLALGAFFRERIKTSLSRSPLFRTATLSTEISPASLTGTYEALEEDIHFNLTLTNPSGRKTFASFAVYQHDIPAELQEVVPPPWLDNLWIMIQAEDEGRSDLSDDKPFSNQINQRIDSLFKNYGYNKVSDEQKQRVKLRISHSLSIVDRGGNDYVENLRLNLRIRVLTADSEELDESRNGRIDLKYSKTMNQDGRKKMISDALPKLVTAVCESLDSAIDVYFFKKFKNK